MKYIILTQGKKAIVDNDQFELLNQWKWHHMKGYAVRREYIGKKRNFRDIYMHRVVNNTPHGLQTDHINRNKLDNRKRNLRSVTSGQNKINVGLRSDNTSRHKGVWFEGSRKKWVAEIMFNKKKKFLGRFNLKSQAIIARKNATKKYHNSFTIAFT